MLSEDVKKFCKRKIQFYARYIDCLNDYLPGSKEIKAYYEGYKDAFQVILTSCVLGRFTDSDVPFPEVDNE